MVIIYDNKQLKPKALASFEPSILATIPRFFFCITLPEGFWWTNTYRMGIFNIFKKEPDLEVNVLNVEEKDGLNYYHGVLFTGKLIEFNAEGDVEATVLCHKGRIIGPYKQFYKSGALEIKKVFVNDEINNETCYYENGKTKYLILYQDGRKTLRQDYYPSGKIKKIKPFTYVERYKDNVPHGVETTYDENGNKMSESLWEYGFPNGTYSF